MSCKIHKYDSNSDIRNFFFHPFHRKNRVLTVTLSIITQLFLTTVSGGLWQIHFWIVNRLDKRRFEILERRREVAEITAKVQNRPPRVRKTNVNPAPTPDNVAAPVSKNGTAVPTTNNETAAPTNIEVPRSTNISTSILGKEKWAEYFGNVEDLPIPPHLNEILAKPCPIFEGKIVAETHLLVLIPEKIDDKDLSLEKLAELVQTPKNGGHVGRCRHYSPYLNKRSYEETAPSHWILIAKDIIGKEDLEQGSRAKPYTEKESMVQKIERKTGITYSVPSLRDVAIAFMIHYAQTKEFLFGEDTFTHCQDTDRDGERVVAGFGANGLLVYSGHRFFQPDDYGMAAVVSFA